MRSKVLTAGLLAATATLLSAVPAQACGAGSSGRARGDLPRLSRAPLVIGDSTMIYAAPKLGSLGFEANARGCRGFAAGVRMLAARRRARTLPALSVLALGANGGASVRAIRSALRVTGPHRVLGLATPRNSRATQRAMRGAARRWPTRVLLIDWARRSAGRTSWFSGDGLHVSHEGAWAFSRLVRARSRPLLGAPRSVRLLHEVRKDCGRRRIFGRRVRVVVLRGERRLPCRRANQVASRRPFEPIPGWRHHRGGRASRSPWAGFFVRSDRRVVIATRAGWG